MSNGAYKDSRNKILEHKFDNDILESYAYELLENRELLEMSYVFCMWKNPEYYDDFNDINPSKDLISNDGKYYYSLGLDMHNIGIKSFDDASIHSFISDNKGLFDSFVKKGGYKAVQGMKKIINVENMESYYDSLHKHNMMLGLYKKGFAIVENLERFSKMNTSQLYDYFEYQLDNTFLNRGGGVTITDLDITDAFIDNCDSGVEKGLSYSATCPILNYHTLGLHRSNVQVFAGFSGTGKTSFIMSSYVMPILDAGEKLVIVANEMNIDAWRHIFLATILSQKLNYFGLPRKKQKTGGFNAEQRAKIKEAQKYWEDHYQGNIKFVKIYDYSMDDVKRVFRKMSKQGFFYGIFDTFKHQDASSAQATGELIEASKQLLQVAEKENMCIIITMQLAIHMENTRYLTGSTLSGAKAVKEVVSELVLMRKIWDDEMANQKYDLKPWKFKRDSITSKLTNTKEFIELKADKKYRIMFLDKTRNDEDDLAMVFQFDGAWNHWKEIGYCTPSHQNR
ncbi:replicative DNA helicase [Psychrobacillus phage Perkons]|nr:replicative DNA helicase [Psychrobacillus phage Perkons]